MSAGHPDPASAPVCSAVPSDPDAARFEPAWRTSTVVAIAKGIAAEGTFGAMPILADALQDAGCDNAVLLDHCRHATGHTAGCWALQLILAKPPPPTPPETSVFVEAVRHMKEPGYLPSERYTPLLGGLLICWILCAGAVVHFALATAETKTQTVFFALILPVGIGIGGKLVYYLASLIAVVRQRREVGEHRRPR